MTTVTNEGVQVQQPKVQKQKKRLKKNQLPVLPPRRERRAQARKEKTEFKPFYNNSEDVQTYEEFYGVGYERFNSKYALIKPIDGDATE